MSIRLRLTLLYSAILVLTLIAFGAVLYTIQAQSTLNSLKRDLSLSSDMLVQSIARTVRDLEPPMPRPERPPPVPIEQMSGEQAFEQLREREILRVLDADGVLVASPFGGSETALSLSAEGLQALYDRQLWWEVVTLEGERLLVCNSPVVVEGEVAFHRSGSPLA